MEEKNGHIWVQRTQLLKLAGSNAAMAVCCILLIVAVVALPYHHAEVPGAGKQLVQVDDKNMAGADDRSLTDISDDFLIAPFDDTEEGRMSAYGYRLVVETYAHIGPESAMPVTGNRLSCSSCHLNGGTKPFAAPFVGLSGVFPIYIGREDKVASLEERINGCLERSMNGSAIATDSKEMRAMVSYIKHVGKGVPIGQRIIGLGFVELNIPDRAADPKRGMIVYEAQCKTCHGPNGEGVKGTLETRHGGYVYPPLWGDDTYNDGAGMARLLTAARFIKGNMPLGVTHDNPILTDEEAYDVAAYLNSQSRPVKAHKERDYPDLKKKPKDCPYPPYADDIPAKQHKFGPFNF